MTFPNLYCYDFSGEKRSLPELRYLLGEQRYGYCERMKSEKAGLCSAYAFLLLRYALCREFGFRDIPLFTFGEHGKPFLSQRPDICFNMSHAGERVVCAVSKRHVGVDIQDIRKVSGRIGKFFLNAAELEQVGTITDEAERNSELCRLWCIKESIGKCTGDGYAGGFTKFDANGYVSSGKVRWTFRDGFYISVCGGE
ncbi:MAG: 4'-phosphopantetheinyl transferase superfamily protein [Ruminiclostridium sp.]|nr:4'-phosphopantetheinyl transferase superfamily protein [Ruminiclostridium sp.]